MNTNYLETTRWKWTRWTTTANKTNHKLVKLPRQVLGWLFQIIFKNQFQPQTWCKVKFQTLRDVTRMIIDSSPAARAPRTKQKARRSSGRPAGCSRGGKIIETPKTEKLRNFRRCRCWWGQTNNARTNNNSTETHIPWSGGLAQNKTLWAAVSKHSRQILTLEKVSVQASQNEDRLIMTTKMMIVIMMMIIIIIIKW